MTNLKTSDPELIHVPFKTVGTIRVRFKEATPMLPRRAVYDDETLDSISREESKVNSGTWN